ncbi:DUF1573 domain-containing protein [Adhaeribacter sp. BT258]|uniref:DUF1573 domain-containing protein n=1 Tax=Adhaeribacter terrigena TaxID=2793070 RepID=A0ABS1C3F4_9BACT|nr:DUF1573 domain-containing protein [Adhaeribacter terrigena]MBK0403853.1 DUF1573 domain-containing protein [Adhaeribacter terrigena]
MKKIFTILPALAFMLASVNAFAQGVLKFESETHDFAKITEGVVATHEFKFKNTGNQPVIISNVQASCGCTTPAWSKDPVLPGKTGFIKAAYNSNGRPGAFNKTITVTSNGSEPTKVLTIKGDVITRAEAAKNYTPEQKAKSPKLVVTNNTHDFGKVETYRQATAKIKVKNTGKTDLVISDVKTNCNCVALQHIPEPIKPNKEATLELSYNPNLLGNRTEVVEIYSNDIVSEPAKVNLKAQVVKSLAPTSVVKEGTNSVPFK